jgi:HAD superfamily hydrolase (TIGR01509 family)
MPVEVIIFDMDGVLVDSEVYWAQARVEFAADRGLVWGGDDHRYVMGRATLEWAEVMKERMALDDSPRAIADEMIERMKAKYEARLPVREGAVEAVNLAAERYRVGLASGSPTDLIQHVTRLTGLDSVFETMVYGDDIARGKPAPDIYFEALRRLEMSPQVAAGIEDSGNGILSLHNAGMKIIAAPSPDFPLKEEHLALAHARIASLTEFTLELVESLG